MSKRSTSTKAARQIQTMTGWKYQFCLQAIQRLGRDVVFAAVETGSDMAAVGRSLNQKMKGDNPKKGMPIRPEFRQGDST
mgnify:CR=1 FL=1